MLVRKEVVCSTEYDALKQVIVSSPDFMRIGKVINETQKQYQAENINQELALAQHSQFVSVMRAHGVTVNVLPPQPALNEQVFTRDIGFTIDSQVFIAKMAAEIRATETDYLKQFLATEGISFQEIEAASIEGGDVIIDGDTVWIGISKRTTMKAINALANDLPNHNIIPIQLKPEILHLDCTFNIIAPNIALIYKNGLDESAYQALQEQYTCIAVDEQEQFTLGTNVLAIGNRRIVSLPENKRVNRDLRAQGFNVIEVPFNEIIKSGGSFRCCTLPINRS
ncbi:N-Dimethylarginine dimethylaminohydrolase [Amphibacillus marinus]|uniref:N-Dimethylarginine dimethylaminohydrolase n=1 Tax=Amphibacillus marinus TaxID=872970 RepID=A0A1H8RHR1_9BACI|nr:arginine deiminase family protein [Amphibacillus marinus]SEO65563.1 N-Dimethylarginine dimethylaminohydrolase [Amphibacillus marinus]